MQKSALYHIANPRSIVFFGASNNFNRMGTIILDSLKALGFSGPVYPVHPKETRVLGYDAYPSVEELPETPELAIIVLPTDIVVQTLEACGQRGTRHAVIVSGGFKEVGGRGPEMEAQLKETADRYGIRFLGPNCLGVANPHHRLNPTPFHYEAQPGFIGLASQSGSFVTQMFDYLAGFDLGFSTAFSVGNEANIDIVDCHGVPGGMSPHPGHRTLYRRHPAGICIYGNSPENCSSTNRSWPSISAGRKRAGGPGSPTPVPWQARTSLYEGMFKQSGIIRAASLTELFDFCWALGTLPIPAGNRVLVQTHSGGPGATAADACDRDGMVLPALSNRTVEALRPFMPHTGTLGNPVDLTFSKSPMDYFAEIPVGVAG